MRSKHKKRRQSVVRGIISVNSRAVGFLAPEGISAKRRGETDIMIETGNLNTALNRDEVEVVLLQERVRGRRTGRVVKIVKRAKTRFVGTLEERGTRLVLVPDDFRFYEELAIPRPPREARRGLKALAELKKWERGQKPQGEIIKVIGKKGEHEVEMESIVLERGFESSFPPVVETEAELIAEEAHRLIKETGSPLPVSEVRKRRDFRQTTLFTIDPANAKDFDDALSFRTLQTTRYNQPTYEIGIHIADVSHYVREDTALDREARERGTSVYLVDRTIPMLPEALSNDLCSLNPGVERLAFSAVFEMNGSGRVLSRWFGKSVIRSQKRFTYEEAQNCIDGRLPAHCSQEDAHLVEILRTLNALAKKLRAEKEKRGAIDFEQDEVGFELDGEGHPLRVFKKERLDAHRLVEEFMLLANREVAQFFFKHSQKIGRSVPFLYRIHDMPDREKIETLRVFARALGHELPRSREGRISGRDLQALFKRVEGKAEESLIKTAAIRSMAKAVYSTENIGHFGLAFEFYTHFTSPIRRYPDLIVHRLLEGLLSRRELTADKLTRLERIGERATQKEIAAAEAERESVKLKQVEFMRDFLGKEFEGVISGVTEWGLYIEERDTKAEGMVKLRDLTDDFYRLDERNYCLVGERTKKRYALGNRLRFRVTGADLERKTLDYELL